MNIIRPCDVSPVTPNKDEPNDTVPIVKPSSSSDHVPVIGSDDWYNPSGIAMNEFHGKSTSPRLASVIVPIVVPFVNTSVPSLAVSS